jgi:hypothetical protein
MPLRETLAGHSKVPEALVVTVALDRVRSEAGSTRATFRRALSGMPVPMVVAPSQVRSSRPT